jgi:hypothetical protein
VTKNGRDDDNPGRFGQSNVVSRADVDDDDDGRTLSYFLYFARTHGDQKESQSLRQLSVYNRREKNSMAQVRRSNVSQPRPYSFFFPADDVIESSYNSCCNSTGGIISIEAQMITTRHTQVR